MQHARERQREKTIDPIQGVGCSTAFSSFTICAHFCSTPESKLKIVKSVRKFSNFREFQKDIANLMKLKILQKFAKRGCSRPDPRFSQPVGAKRLDVQNYKHVLCGLEDVSFAPPAASKIADQSSTSA